MIKNNKAKAIISSLVILSPILFGIIMWDKLPGFMSTHWGADGVSDSQAPKAIAILLLPLILLALHWLCLIITAWDNRGRNQTRTAEGIVFWILPFISFFANTVMYALALGYYKMSSLLYCLIGAVLAIMGNYLPKIRRNRTLGIKIKWTLESDENWNATHRFGGKVWTIGGLCFIPLSFLPGRICHSLFFALILAITIIPIIYSYIFYKKQKENGTLPETDPNKPSLSKGARIVIGTIIALFGIGICILMFTGNVNIDINEDSISIGATFWGHIEVNYDDIESIEFRESFDKGTRTYGFGSARLSLGSFNNDEFEIYTLYSYNSCDSAVIIKAEGKTLAVNAKSYKATKALYLELCEHIEGGEK